MRKLFILITEPSKTYLFEDFRKIFLAATLHGLPLSVILKYLPFRAIIKIWHRADCDELFVWQKSSTFENLLYLVLPLSYLLHLAVSICFVRKTLIFIFLPNLLLYLSISICCIRKCLIFGFPIRHFLYLAVSTFYIWKYLILGVSSQLPLSRLRTRRPNIHCGKYISANVTSRAWERKIVSCSVGT